MTLAAATMHPTARCARVRVDPFVLAHEHDRRRIVGFVRAWAARHGYTGRLRFDRQHSAETFTRNLPPVYWIEVHRMTDPMRHHVVTPPTGGTAACSATDPLEDGSSPSRSQAEPSDSSSEDPSGSSSAPYSDAQPPSGDLTATGGAR